MAIQSIFDLPTYISTYPHHSKPTSLIHENLAKPWPTYKYIHLSTPAQSYLLWCMAIQSIFDLPTNISTYTHQPKPIFSDPLQSSPILTYLWTHSPIHTSPGLTTLIYGNLVHLWTTSNISTYPHQPNPIYSDLWQFNPSLTYLLTYQPIHTSQILSTLIHDNLVHPWPTSEHIYLYIHIHQPKPIYSDLYLLTYPPFYPHQPMPIYTVPWRFSYTRSNIPTNLPIHTSQYLSTLIHNNIVHSWPIYEHIHLATPAQAYLLWSIAIQSIFDLPSNISTYVLFAPA